MSEDITSYTNPRAVREYQRAQDDEAAGRTREAEIRRARAEAIERGVRGVKAAPSAGETLFRQKIAERNAAVVPRPVVDVTVKAPARSEGMSAGGTDLFNARPPKFTLDPPGEVPLDSLLPDGVAGDMLYHNGTEWVVLAAPTGMTENPVLRFNLSTTAPYWDEPEGC